MQSGAMRKSIYAKILFPIFQHDNFLCGYSQDRPRVCRLVLRYVEFVTLH